MSRMLHRVHPELLVDGATLDVAVARRAWRFVRAYRPLLAVYGTTILVASVLGVVPPLLFKSLIDDAIPAGDLRAVNLLAAGAVAVAAASTALNLAQRWLQAKIGEGVIFDLRVALYEHVQRMPIAFFVRAQTGSLLARLSTDVVGAQQSVATGARVLSNVTGLAATLVAMVALSWRVTAAALLVVPLFVAVDRRVAGRLKRIARQRMALTAAMTTTMAERFNVAGALLVKLFGRPQQELDTFSERAAGVRDTGVTQAVTSRVLLATLGLVGAVGTAGVYWLGARSVVDGSLELGTVVALAAYVQRLYNPLVDLAGARIELLSAVVSFERVFEVLDAPAAASEHPHAVDLEEPEGRVEALDVWFRYPPPSAVAVSSLEEAGAAAEGDELPWVLRGVSFVAEPGTMTALVGPSGAGKSTLSWLLARLYDVVSGCIRLDGRDVRELTHASLARTVGMVTQDPHLFHDTVAANLRYARPDASDDDLAAACRAAQIHEVIAALPAGYATVVGERGYRLSGGEKQRLALARLLLKDPAVVILDEATAHLDSETEALVQRALTTALAGRTSVVIAHRLSTVRAADQILVLDGGRIVDRGRHEELVARSGLYRELYETQYQRGGEARGAAGGTAV